MCIDLMQKRWSAPAHTLQQAVLICKQLVQSVHPVPPVFFLEAKQHKNTPFWRHPGWKPIDDGNIVKVDGELHTDLRDEEAAAAVPPGKDIPSDDDDLLDVGSKLLKCLKNQWKKKLRSYVNCWAALNTKYSFGMAGCCRHSNEIVLPSFKWQRHVSARRGGCSQQEGRHQRHGSDQQAVWCSTVPGQHILIPTCLVGVDVNLTLTLFFG